MIGSTRNGYMLKIEIIIKLRYFSWFYEESIIIYSNLTYFVFKTLDVYS